jgi:hypothetical protein
LIPSIPKVTSRSQFTKKEQKELDKIGATKAGGGRWAFLDGGEMISKPLMRELMSILHRGCH